MPQFNEHIHQAERNLQFLGIVNASAVDFFDWQVTVCFYTSLHWVNAHLSLFNMQYRKHVDVKDALNPQNPQSVRNGSALPPNEYLAYTKLQSLSRRSRYLVNEKDGNLGKTQAFLTYDIHLNKSLKHLNTLIKFFSNKYNIPVTPIGVTCSGINKGDLSFATL